MLKLLATTKLSPAQWQQLIPVLKERQLLPYLDIAYQGYGDGIAEDAFAIRALARARMAKASSSMPSP